MKPSIHDRILGFVRGRSSEPFDRLASDAFRFQAAAIPALARLAAARGVDPNAVRTWREVPAVPAATFADVALAAAPAVEVFRSSGTTGGTRSVHRHPFPGLYRAVIDASFPGFCLDSATDRPPMLALVPPRSQVADSSLGFMIDHVLERFGGEGSAYAFGSNGVETAKATAFCREREADGRPALVLSTAFALVQWLDSLEKEGTRLALPRGSTVFETGGTKGRVRAIGRAELLAGIHRRLGVPSSRVVREYGMTELTSQLYSRSLRGGDPDRLVGPSWARPHVVDPLTFEDVAAGETGLVAVFDLANVGSAVHVLTEDLGVMEGPGIRLLGRASGAALRGCSLTVEELTNPPTDGPS